MSINCNLNNIIYNFLDSPDQDQLVINLHFAFICACFGGILQTFKKCQTLGQFFESLYLFNPEEQVALDKFLEDMLKRGYICPPKSPFTSPFFFVKKKDGKLCPVQDYRRLNTITIKNQYPLPLIPDVIDKLRDVQIFTKFDIRWGYNNVRINEGDKWKATFKTNKGMFEPLVMFFGLTNSPATFQSMMNELFKDLIDTGLVFIYIDDILIATKTMEQHRELVKQVLQRLWDNNLFLKPEKCDFEKEQMDYLGLILKPGHIAMDPIKLQGIADWPIPQNLRDVRALGLQDTIITSFKVSLV